MISSLQEQKMPLSLEEFAILAFTNDGEFDRIVYEERMFDYPYDKVLTGKESYFWAVTISLLTKQCESMNEERIKEAYDYAVTNNIDLLRKKYLSKKLNYYGDSIDKQIFESLIKDFIGRIGCPNIELDKIIAETQKAYESLVDKGLIEDPLEIAAGTIVVGVLGLIPYGFTIKTRKGKVVYRKITAGFWSYEKRYGNGIEETNVNFRLYKYLSAIKNAVIKVAQEGIDNPGK